MLRNIYGPILAWTFKRLPDWVLYEALIEAFLRMGNITTSGKPVSLKDVIKATEERM